MRILIASTTYAPALNGQAVFSTNLAEGLAAEGHIVRVIVPSIDRQPLTQVNGVLIEAIHALDLRFIHQDMTFAWAFPPRARALIDEFQPDVIHLQDPSPISQALLRAARQSRIPTIATHHPGPAIWAPYFSAESWLVDALVIPLAWGYFIRYLNRVDQVVTPSLAAARMLRDHHLLTPLKAISCGVPPSSSIKSDDSLRGKLNESPVFLYVGRLDAEKRVEVLLQAFARVREEQAILLLAGSGASEKPLHALAAQSKLGERVRFLGNVERDHLADLLSQSDVFVMPGDSESLSIATLEAMSAGKPVIAARAMALPEIVADGINGLLFAPGDPGDLAMKMDQMISMRSQWRGMGAASRARAEMHAFPHTLEAYNHLYHDLRASRIRVELPKTNRWAIPRWIQDPVWVMNLVQWAALVTILIISLITRNHVVIAAPAEDIPLISPEMLADIQRIMQMLRHLELDTKFTGSLLNLLIRSILSGL